MRGWLNGLRLALVAGLAAAFLGMTAPADAAVAPAAKSHAHGSVLKELHHAKELLEKADHDYDGHRAKAVHEITQAIHELTGHHHKGTTAPHPHKAIAKPKGGQGLKEPQAESDKQLHEAVHLLKEAEPHLHQHPAAAKNIAEAIHELHVALKIK